MRPAEPDRKAVLSVCDIRVSPARAAELRSRLQEVIEELGEPAADAAGDVPISALIAFYAAPEPDTG
jgi:hypothetical protein